MSDVQPQTRLDRLTRSRHPFIDGPAETLVKGIAAELLKVEEFKLVFGEYIDPYMRMDFPISSLPALRIYSPRGTKTSDSGFIDGDVVIDAIFPLTMRRAELQQLPDIVVAAMMQQFRRPSFFATLQEEYVPGLNRLGYSLRYDKMLALQLDAESEPVPLVQMTLDFRVDLRAWDDYLTETLRTKDDPFKETLAELRRFIGGIQGIREDETVMAELGVAGSPSV